MTALDTVMLVLRSELDLTAEVQLRLDPSMQTVQLAIARHCSPLLTTTSHLTRSDPLAVRRQVALLTLVGVWPAFA